MNLTPRATETTSTVMKTTAARSLRAAVERVARGGLTPSARLARLFVTIAVLALPIVAHGCHSDDVDHEPLFVPFRLNADDR